jgi:hypothetical protein
LRTAPSVTASLFAEQPTAELTGADSPSVDRELEAWKQARGSKFQMPWSQLSLMASLCFGIASFVLPDSVNDNVDWLLWGLMAISAYIGFAKRRKKTVPA